VKIKDRLQPRDRIFIGLFAISLGIIWILMGELF